MTPEQAAELLTMVHELYYGIVGHNIIISALFTVYIFISFRK